jgi:diguanylate cyclase (GGDEF)-like protein
MLYIYLFIVRRDSRQDALTGIGNRFSFNEFVDKMTRLEGKRGVAPEEYAIVMFDLDGFKEINDTLGHSVGDQALQDMAEILRNNIRDGDMPVRWGGDEFVVVCRNISDTSVIIRRIQEALDRFNDRKIRPYRLQTSYGAGVYIAGGAANGGLPIQEFMESIDTRMYSYKYEHSEKRKKSEEALK